MERKLRSIVFVIPAALSAAVDASEMAVDFLSKVDWLRNDLSSLGTQIRRGILQAVRGSLRDRRRHIAVSIDVFPEDCVIRVSQRGLNAKQLTTHLTRGSAKSPEPDEEFSAKQEVCVS